MTITNFTPTLWAGAMLKNLNDAHVYVQCCNRDYEGLIKAHGDTVKINSIGRVTIGSYTKGSTIGAPETLQDSQSVLQITEQKFFNFQIDDIDKAQNNLRVMNEAMREAAWGLADTADAFVAEMLADNAANIVTAATVGTGAGDADAYEVLVDLGVELTEQNVPHNGRWVVVPPWFEGLLRKDPRWVSFGTSENRKNLSGDLVKKVAGLDLMVSNNVPDNSSAKWIVAGYDGAATFADSIPPGDMEAFRPETLFSDAMKGLHVYGGKVTRPYALAKCSVTRA